MADCVTHTSLKAEKYNLSEKPVPVNLFSRKLRSRNRQNFGKHIVKYEKHLLICKKAFVLVLLNALNYMLTLARCKLYTKTSPAIF